MREGMICSAGLHASLIAVAVVGLPRLWTPDPPPEIIAVEVVTMAEAQETEPTPPPEVKPVQAPPPEVKAEPEPPPQAVKPEPPPVQQAALPDAVPPAAPEPPPPVAAPEPTPSVATPKPKPEPPTEVAKPAPKPPEVGDTAPPPPTPRRKPAPKPPRDELQALLKDLARQRDELQAKQKNHATSGQLALAAPEAPSLSPIERRRVAADLAQAVKRQVTPCWSIPAGIKDAAEMRIGVRIFLNPDGSLRGEPQIEDRRRLDDDTGYRAVAESALRALRNPRCSPLRLPIKQYELWQEITFNFDPRELLEP